MENKLNDFFIEKFSLDFLKDNNELSSKSFFCEEINITPYNLLYVYKFIEEELQINIDEEFIIANGFMNFNSLRTYIYEKTKSCNS